MNFGQALEAIKAGHNVARRGWNGKGMHLFLMRGALQANQWGYDVGEEIPPSHPSTQDGVSISLFDARDCDEISILPSIGMKTASGSLLIGWLASQTDMLAEDWERISE